MTLCKVLKRLLIPALITANCFGPVYAQKAPLIKNTTKTLNSSETTEASTPVKGFNVEAESFADLQVLRYQVPGFDQLSLKQKQLAYYLSEAALCGRDILYDQKSKYGLLLRKTLETAYTTYQGDKTSDDWKKFAEYCGRFWFSNGNHHHYANQKFIPDCSFDYFGSVIKNSDTKKLPLEQGETTEAFLTRIRPLVYDPSV